MEFTIDVDLGHVALMDTIEGLIEVKSETYGSATEDILHVSHFFEDALGRFERWLGI